MKKAECLLAIVTVCCIVVFFLGSCSNNAPESKTAVVDTAVKPRWADPQKGKIWGKVNVVQISLTAIEEHILGSVKSVRYKEYKISGKDSSKILDDSGYNVYDKFGHLVDQNEYAADGSPKWKCIYKYDGRNKAIEWDFDNSYRGKYSTKITFKYDDKGNKVEEHWVSTEKKYSNRTVYTYDDKGNETGDTLYVADATEGLITGYKYDNRGFQTEITMWGKGGKIVRKAAVEYDDKGDKTGGTDYSSDTGIAGTWKSAIDNKGRTTQTVYYNKAGAIIASSKMKYDDWDNIIESITNKPDGSIDTTGWNTYTEFEYDSKGNAIKETDYKIKDDKKVPTDIREAEYVYY